MGWRDVRRKARSPRKPPLSGRLCTRQERTRNGAPAVGAMVPIEKFYCGAMVPVEKSYCGVSFGGVDRYETGACGLGTRLSSSTAEPPLQAGVPQAFRRGCLDRAEVFGIVVLRVETGQQPCCIGAARCASTARTRHIPSRNLPALRFVARLAKGRHWPRVLRPSGGEKCGLGGPTLADHLPLGRFPSKRPEIK